MADQEILTDAELCVIALLHADRAFDFSQKDVKTSLSMGGARLWIGDQGRFLKFEEMNPDSVYTCQFGDGSDERLFATSHDDLLFHPGEIFGDKAEVAFIDEKTSSVRWFGLRRRKKLPQGCITIANPSFIYERHLKIIDMNTGEGRYQKRMVLYDKSGISIPAKIRGQFVADDGAGDNQIILASIIEDAHRKNSMLAAVRGEIEIKFPVPLDSYKSIFSIRDSPLTASGKKAAILHWVAKHTRKSCNGITAQVKTHLRGIHSFEIEGLRITISAN